MCQVITALAAEMNKGSESFYWPYLDVLATDSVDVPLTWEADRLQWLQGIYNTADWNTGSMFLEKGCNFDPTDATLMRAGLLVFSRATAVQVEGQDLTCMCPVYDLMNHDNAALNTAGGVSPGKVLSVGTLEEVDKGGQLFNSFGPNNVAAILRDYGFLPSYPRVWEFAAPLPKRERAVGAMTDNGDSRSRSSGSSGGSGSSKKASDDGAAGDDEQEVVLFVFEELVDKRIDLNPSQASIHQIDRRLLAEVLRAHLTEVETHTSALNEALLASTAIGTNTTALQEIHRAKWFRDQYTQAFSRALRASEATADSQGRVRRSLVSSKSLRDMHKRKRFKNLEL